MDDLLNEVQNTSAGRLTVNDASSRMAWVKQLEYPPQGDRVAPILPVRGAENIVQIHQYLDVGCFTLSSTQYRKNDQYISGRRDRVWQSHLAITLLILIGRTLMR